MYKTKVAFPWSVGLKVAGDDGTDMEGLSKTRKGGEGKEGGLNTHAESFFDTASNRFFDFEVVLSGQSGETHLWYLLDYHLAALSQGCFLTQ